MTENWRKRLDATLDAIVQARIQTAADVKDAGKRRAAFPRHWKTALGSAIEPALAEAGEPWRQRGLESSLTVSESPRSATLSVTIEPLGPAPCSSPAIQPVCVWQCPGHSAASAS